MHNTSPEGEYGNANGAFKVDRVAILDAGAQYGKVIDRKVSANMTKTIKKGGF